MAKIRPLEPEDLPAVEALLGAHMPLWESSEGFLRRSLIDDPWAEPDLRSLVAVVDGRVVGFLGAQPRRFRFRGESLRAVCASHLVVDPESRAGAAGALLLRDLIRGPQDLTWSDTATDVVARLWHAFGGEVDFTRRYDWRIPLRPVRWLWGRATSALRDRGDRAEGRHGADGPPAESLPGARAATALERVGELVHTGRRPPGSDGTGIDLAAPGLADRLPRLTEGLELFVEYDAPELDHLFSQIRMNQGALVVRAVERDGEPLGWYAYLPLRSGPSRVLSVHAKGANHLDAVFGDLIADARGRGCVALSGRVEPHLAEWLGHRHAQLGFARRPISHTARLDLRASLGTPRALLTRLDGEWFAP